jgi:hypothetical protein
MPPEQHLIPELEFDDSWGAYVSPSGALFTFEDVRNQPHHHVWTVVESGDDSDGSWYAQPGLHIVNKLGYVMTRKPWTDTTPDAVYFLDDFED